MHTTDSTTADGTRRSGNESINGNSVSIRDTGIVILISNEHEDAGRRAVEQSLCALTGIRTAIRRWR